MHFNRATHFYLKHTTMLWALKVQQLTVYAKYNLKSAIIPLLLQRDISFSSCLMLLGETFC